MNETTADENELIVFNEEFESLKNGNILLFKDFLENSDGDKIYNFIKWLQSEGLKI